MEKLNYVGGGGLFRGSVHASLLEAVVRVKVCTKMGVLANRLQMKIAFLFKNGVKCVLQGQ